MSSDHEPKISKWNVWHTAGNVHITSYPGDVNPFIAERAGDVVNRLQPLSLTSRPITGGQNNARRCEGWRYNRGLYMSDVPPSGELIAKKSVAMYEIGREVPKSSLFVR
jgi:hypothetical protein